MQEFSLDLNQGATREREDPVRECGDVEPISPHVLFFQKSRDLMAIVQKQGVFLEKNASWERVFGGKLFTPASTVFDFMELDDVPAAQKHFEQSWTAARSEPRESRFKKPCGGAAWFEWTMTPLDENGTGYLVARDISERKRVDQRLVEMNRELESFCYIVSHDLRAPLRAMQGFADALVEDYAFQLDSVAQDYARRIVGASRRMDRLIQDLLIYSRLTRNEIPLSSLPLESALDEALGVLEGELQKAGTEIQKEEPLPAVRAHQPTLVQVLTHLIDNAIKFVGPDVTPVIRFYQEENGDCVRLWIQDNGIGISPEFHAKIFRVFERLHPPERYPGTGIGLAIARRGMERMEGRLGVESELGQGSRFWIELKRAL
jgi:PAS domain S-box-containing protein